VAAGATGAITVVMCYLAEDYHDHVKYYTSFHNPPLTQNIPHTRFATHTIISTLATPEPLTRTINTHSLAHARTHSPTPSTRAQGG
jgi:hypothetical protein